MAMSGTKGNNTEDIPANDEAVPPSVGKPLGVGKVSGGAGGRRPRRVDSSSFATTASASSSSSPSLSFDYATSGSMSASSELDDCYVDEYADECADASAPAEEGGRRTKRSPAAGRAASSSALAASRKSRRIAAGAGVLLVGTVIVAAVVVTVALRRREGDDGRSASAASSSSSTSTNVGSDPGDGTDAVSGEDSVGRPYFDEELLQTLGDDEKGHEDYGDPGGALAGGLIQHPWLEEKELEEALEAGETSWQQEEQGGGGGKATASASVPTAEGQTDEEESTAVQATASASVPTAEGQTDDKESTAHQSSGRVTYEPGNLTRTKLGVRLSKGLDIRRIAVSGRRVRLTGLADDDEEEEKGGGGAKWSEERFHSLPDGAATFPVPTDSPYHDIIPGGWAYTSNSEEEYPNGGVGSIYFDRDGNVVDYKRLLDETDRNCSGGRTPWGTWVSCEEPWGERTGKIYELDPFRPNTARRTTLDDGGGRYEAFAYDIRDASTPRFYYTEDDHYGPVRQYTPDTVDWNNPHDMLHGTGEIKYLVIEPAYEGANFGTFYWSSSRDKGERSANTYYPKNEGIDVLDGHLYFANNWWLLFYSLDLDAKTWTSTSTIGGMFDGTPDQLARIVGGRDEILYFTEDGETCGAPSGVHGRDGTGKFFSVVESEDWEESSGLAFSPDGKRMYFADQIDGALYEVWREDGLPFYGRTARVQYHAVVGEPVPGWEGDTEDYWGKRHLLARV